MLKRPPPPGQQREPALAQAARRPQERIPSTGTDIELFHTGGFLYRDVDAVTFVCAFVAGIGQSAEGNDGMCMH